LTILTEGGRRGRGSHISEGEEGKIMWADQRPLGQLAGGLALGRGEVGRDWAKTEDGPKCKKKLFSNFN
jgi:hypothetical protein